MIHLNVGIFHKGLLVAILLPYGANMMKKPASIKPMLSRVHITEYFMNLPSKDIARSTKSYNFDASKLVIK